MKKKKESGERKRKRQPPVKIPLSFEKAVDGLLGLSPEDAKAVRESRPGTDKPRKK